MERIGIVLLVANIVFAIIELLDGRQEFGAGQFQVVFIELRCSGLLRRDGRVDFHIFNLKSRGLMDWNPKPRKCPNLKNKTKGAIKRWLKNRAKEKKK